MKFTINTKAASEAVKKCLAAAGTRTTLPILSCIRIDAAGDEVRMTATDLDRWMECRIPAEVERAGSAAVSSRMLAGILGRGGSETAIEADAKHKCTLRTAGSVFRLAGLAADELPDTPACDGPPIDLPAADWAESSRAVHWAASTDAGRPSIAGMHVTPDGGALHFVGTNGSRLSRSVLQQEVDFPGITIPTDAVRTIDAILGGGESLTLRVGENLLTATCGSETVTVRLLDLGYPNYRHVIPNWEGAATTKCTIPSRPFLDAIERASLVLTDASHGVDLDISEGKILISGSGEDRDATSEVEAEVSGPPLKIRFSAAFLADPVRRWEAESVELEVESPLAPGILRAGNHQYVMMPMRIM